MPRKVCFVYQWATYGGVERVFLNRALAFQSAGVDVHVDVFYGADGGGLDAFSKTIEALGLGDRIRVVERFKPDDYEVVFVIDSPGMLPTQLSDATKWVVECHTAYAGNRAYLADLPSTIAEVVVPSNTFADLLSGECPRLAGRIRVLRNCVATSRDEPDLRLPNWQRIPLLYFGRLDDLKNPAGFLDLIRELERRQPRKFFGLVLGPEVPGYDFDSRIEQAGLRGTVVRMPPLQFLRTQSFLRAWRGISGVMVSPSHGESFGLAAAESIAAGIPVLLSALPEHAELVGGDARYLYDPRNAAVGADKVESMIAAYEENSRRMLELAKAHGSEAFVADWQSLMAALALVKAEAAIG